MAYDPISGQWRDDSTGLPDMGMPAGMGDFSGAPTRQPPPQQISPQPMMSRPQPRYTPIELLTDPSKAGIAPEEISPPIPTGAVAQEWNKLVRPEMSGGDIAGAVLSSPLTVPMGIVEELRGLFGGSTIAGWGAQAEARYSDPNYSESRAFGVPTAQPLGFGDRFVGVVSGRAQQKAGAGLALRAEIGRYNKQRGQEIGQFKDVMDIYKGSTDLQQNIFRLEHQGEDFSSKLDTRRAAQRSSNASSALSEYTLNKKQEDAATVQALANALSADPSLADGNHTSALMAIAKGNLNLVKQALEITAAGINMPSADTGLTKGQSTTAQLGPVPAIAEAYGADAIRQAQEAAEAAKTEAANARADAAKALERQQQLTDRGSTLEQDLAKEARGRVEDLYKPRLAGLTNDFLGQSRIEKAEEMNQEKARVIGFLEQGGLSRNEAYAIASGDYDALATPIDQPTPAPGSLTPTPTATPTPRPTGEAPAQIRERVLKEKMDEILGGARPTPMATPAPRPTTSASSEGARQDNATRVTQYMARFDEKWKRERVPLGKPLRGADYYRDLDTNLARLGLKRETTE